MNARQTERLKRLADWLHENDRKFLFELLVPGRGPPARDGRRGQRPLRHRAPPRPDARTIVELQDAGRRGGHLEDRGDRHARGLRADRRAVARRDGRDDVICVVLGRGANDEKVDHWLQQGAGVAGYVGFAIGRTIWWDALKGFIDGDLEREAAADQSRTTTCASCGCTTGRTGDRSRVAFPIQGRLSAALRGQITLVAFPTPCGCVSPWPSSRRPSVRRPLSPSNAASGCASRPSTVRAAAGSSAAARRGSCASPCWRSRSSSPQ